MTSKELLENCREAALSLRTLSHYMTGVNLTGQPSGVKVQHYDVSAPGTNDPTAAAIQLYDGLMAQHAELHAQYTQLVEQARQRIMRLTNTRQVIILLRYYIEGLSDQDIAQALHLSREYINKLRHDGLKHL